jgi:WD40 repeat protein
MRTGKFHRPYLAIGLGGILLLLVGSLAIGVKPVRTWASLVARDSLSVRDDAVRFLFSPDGGLLASVDGATVVVRDVASGQALTFLRGESDAAVSGIAFDDASRTVAIARENGRIELWDARSGSLKLTLSGHHDRITAIAFSADGKMMASGGSDARAMLWDLPSGSLRFDLSVQRDVVSAIAFSPDGTMLATGGDDTRLWDVATGTERFALPSKGAASVTGLVFARDGKALASIDSEANVVLWDLGTRSVRQAYAGPEGVANGVAFDGNGAAFAAGTKDGLAKIWDASSGDERASLRSPFGTAVADVVFSPDSRLLAVRSQDTRIALWDVLGTKLQKVLVGHRDFVAAVAFGTEPKTFASVAKDGQLIVWDLDTGLQRYAAEAPSHEVAPVTSVSAGGAQSVSSAPGQLAIPSDPAIAAEVAGTHSEISPQALSANTIAASRGDGKGKGNKGNKRKRQTLTWKGLTSIALSPDGALLGGVSNNGKIEVWNATTGRSRMVFPRGVAFPVSGVSFSADGRRLLSVGKDTVLRTWDIDKGKEGRGLLGHEHAIRSIATSPSSSLMASAGEDTWVMLWDGESGKLNKIFYGHEDFVNSVTFGFDGKTLASGAADGRVIIWDIASGKSRHTLLGHSDEVNAVVFSRDGKLLASAGEDKRVILWDVASGQQILALEGHQGPVRALAFSRDGRSLASAGEDSQIVVWSLGGGSSKSIPGVTSTVNGLAFSPDGGTLFTGSEDNQMVRWDVSRGQRGSVLN